MADNGFGKLSMQVDDRDRYGSPGQPRHAGPGQPRTGASGRSGQPPRCVRRSSTSRMRARL